MTHVLIIYSFFNEQCVSIQQTIYRTAVCCIPFDGRILGCNHCIRLIRFDAVLSGTTTKDI